MKRFELHRDHDVSGISGTGTVAEGVEFSDGHVVIRWVTNPSSTSEWDSLADAIAIHGHGGATRVVWIDGKCRTYWKRLFRSAFSLPAGD